MKYIIGGGVAGLVYLHYHPEFKIITLYDAGQLGSAFQLGPRLIEDTLSNRRLLQSYNLIFTCDTINIGFESGGTVFDTMPLNFAKTYAQQSRNVTDVEGTFMSSGRSTINILTNRKGDIYLKLMNAMRDRLASNILYKDIKRISKNFIKFSGERSLKFNEIVNTIPLDKFVALQGYSDLEMPVINKYFKAIKTHDYYPYDYIYSIDGNYTRKTFFDGYAMLESSKEIVCKGENVLFSKVLPIQLTKSLCITSMRGFTNVGRYAEIDHSITITKLTERYAKNI